MSVHRIGRVPGDVRRLARVGEAAAESPPLLFADLGAVASHTQAFPHRGPVWLLLAPADPAGPWTARLRFTRGHPYGVGRCEVPTNVAVAWPGRRELLAALEGAGLARHPPRPGDPAGTEARYGDWSAAYPPAS